MKKLNIKKILIIALAITFGIGVYYSPEIYSLWPNIETFNPSRDSYAIADIIQRDVYWFFNEPLKEPFREKHLIPYFFSKNYKFYVLRVRNKTVGFIIYKKIDPFTGNISLIGVQKEYRKYHYGEKLLNFAIKDLFNDGCSKIKLYTRTSNIAAQRLYLKTGFKEVSQENGYVFFEKFKD